MLRLIVSSNAYESCFGGVTLLNAVEKIGWRQVMNLRDHTYLDLFIFFLGLSYRIFYYLSLSYCYSTCCIRYEIENWSSVSYNRFCISWKYSFSVRVKLKVFWSKNRIIRCSEVD